MDGIQIIKKKLIIYVFLSSGDDSSNFLLPFSNCHESTHSVLGFLQYFLALGYKINSKAHYCFFLKNKTRTKKDSLYNDHFRLLFCFVFFFRPPCWPKSLNPNLLKFLTQ